MNSVEIKIYNQYIEDEVLPLYESVGWVNYVNNPQLLMKAYENSLLCLVAILDNKIVGVLRLVGDGASIIYFQDIIVSPSYQRQGIGKLLITKAMDLYKNVYQKVLITDNQPDTVGFYKSLGFSLDRDINCAAFIQFQFHQK